MGPLPLDPTDRDTPTSESGLSISDEPCGEIRELCVSQKQLAQQSTTFSFSIGARGVFWHESHDLRIFPTVHRVSDLELTVSPIISNELMRRASRVS